MRPYKEWRREAVCLSGDAEQAFRENSRKAKQHCSSCPVKRDCLNYALLYGEEGVWGGTSTADRTQILLRVPQVQNLLKAEAIALGILEHRYSIEEYFQSIREARKLAGKQDQKPVVSAIAHLPTAEEFVVPEEEYYIQWVS